MEILTSSSLMKDWARQRRTDGKTVGLVPTMGYLHEGHLSLIRRSRTENDLTVVSLFVNPAQFGPHEDLDRYPRDEKGDRSKCEALGTDVLFMPTASGMYGPDHRTYVDVEGITRSLCGASRPGHFRGVATVVIKLFNIVMPSAAYFGQKDHQQLQVIKTMVRDLDMDVRVVPCETVREEDGLAMSSRNAYLSPERRQAATCLYKALLTARKLFLDRRSNAEEYLHAMTEKIAEVPDAVIDYVSLVHPENLEDLRDVGDKALAVLAVRIGNTRLIDNMLLERPA